MCRKRELRVNIWIMEHCHDINGMAGALIVLLHFFSAHFGQSNTQAIIAIAMFKRAVWFSLLIDDL